MLQEIVGKAFFPNRIQVGSGDTEVFFILLLHKKSSGLRYRMVLLDGEMKDAKASAPTGINCKDSLITLISSIDTERSSKTVHLIELVAEIVPLTRSVGLLGLTACPKSLICKQDFFSNL